LELPRRSRGWHQVWRLQAGLQLTGELYRGKYAEIARRPTHAELDRSWRRARELGLKFETTTFERRGGLGMPVLGG